MANPILARRIPYDINGTIIGYNTSVSFANPPTAWFDSATIGKMNDDIPGTVVYTGYNAVNWRKAAFWFFPEKMEFEFICAQGYGSGYATSVHSIQGSNDTTNGVDGTWEAATFPSGGPTTSNSSDLAWRDDIFPISFSTSYRCLRMIFHFAARSLDSTTFKLLHLYGRKAFLETPDDVLICDIDGNELATLMDWGDRPEGTTAMKAIKIKNASANKKASMVNLQFNHTNFGMSFNVAGPWTSTLDLGDIVPNGISEPIYIKNTIGDPPQLLGPKAGRLIVSVANFV